MKVVHWTMHNSSGMNRAADTLCKAECALGLQSILRNPQEVPPDNFDSCLDADIHVSHTHFPDAFRRRITKPYRLVWIGHGTPEHSFQSAVESGEHKPYGCSDSWMLMQHWLQTADAIVTHWPRHQAIWKSLVDKNTPVHLVPLGVDKSFWKPLPSRGAYAGSPSVLTAENCHYIKWPLDLFIAWPWVYPRVTGNPSLHCLYLPTNLHRWFFPLVNRNGCAYASHLTACTFNDDDLRNAFNSINFFTGLVRYGDFNRLSLEANACGAATISYRGNPYSAYWVDEGDQRVLADQLVDILNGRTIPRDASAGRLVVPDASDTAVAMKSLYESLF